MPNMRDPFGSMQGFINQFSGAMRNPQQMIMGRLGIPQNFSNDPNGAIQWLMNNGRVSQNTYNQARNIANQIQGNTQFQQSMGFSSNQG